MYPDIQPLTLIGYNPLYSPSIIQLLYCIYKVMFYAGSAMYLTYSAKCLHSHGLIKSAKPVIGLIAIGLGVTNLLILSSLVMLTIGFLVVSKGLSD